MVTDPIGNFINCLKNASAVAKTEVSVPYSKLNHEIAKVLESEGYLKSVDKTGKGVEKSLVVELSKPINSAYRISKPSRRLYTRANKAPAGRGITILTTPKGIMTSTKAKEERVGGEILFRII